MAATDCVGFLDADLPPVPPPTPRAPAALTELIAGTLWPLADWKGNRAQCERAAQAVVRLIVSIDATTAALYRAADEETQRLVVDAARANATIDHLRSCMARLTGHNRQDLDPLAEANYEARAREAAVGEARRWARRAWTAEAAVERVSAWCDYLDSIVAVTDAVHPVAANIRHHLAGATEEGPK
ncbi:hypothetical protein [Streptomyces mirabilis]|uniref:hypothetical protein n=1 Tax=Streptomyces mirabilis TaxID=68239 RepID=UPI0033B2D419